MTPSRPHRARTTANAPEQPRPGPSPGDIIWAPLLAVLAIQLVLTVILSVRWRVMHDASLLAYMGMLVERFGFVPLNTVIIVSRRAIERCADLPSVLFEAFCHAQAKQEAEAPPEDEEVYRRLERDTSRPLRAHGFAPNRVAIREGIAYAYEQGIIRRLRDAEELFLLTHT